MGNDKKDDFFSNLNELAQKARDSATENEAIFLQAIEKNELNTIQQKHEEHLAPGTHLPPEEQIKNYIDKAKTPEMADVLWKIYPKAAVHRRFLSAIEDDNVDDIQNMQDNNLIPGMYLPPEEQIKNYIDKAKNPEMTDILWKIYHKAAEHRLLNAIETGDINNIQNMQDNDLIPGKELNPKEQLKYIVHACNSDAKKEMFDILFKVYPQTANEPLLLEDKVIEKAANNTPWARFWRFVRTESTKIEIEHSSCFSTAMYCSLNCARALIDALKSITGFQNANILAQKESILHEKEQTADARARYDVGK